MKIVLDKYTSFNTLTIWEPRWRDKRVLLAKHKIGEHNKINITQEHKDGTRYFPNDMYISGKEARRYKVESNGVIPCYAVPLDKLKVLSINKHSVHELW